MDESPRWLIVRGRFNEALSIIEKAARWNKVNLPQTEELLQFMTKIQKEVNQLRH